MNLKTSKGEASAKKLPVRAETPPPLQGRQTKPGETHRGQPLLILFGFGFEIVNHFSKQSHGEEATLVVLSYQPVGEKRLFTGLTTRPRSWAGRSLSSPRRGGSLQGEPGGPGGSEGGESEGVPS